MSELERLIQEHCPNGVNYVAVGELVKSKIIQTITPTFKVKRNDYKESGSTPIISQEAEFISGYCDVVDENILDGKYVCFGDHSEHIKYVDFSFVQGADGLKIMCTDESVLLPRYLYHSASAFYKRHNNYERHFKYFGDTVIPVPPLEVQREIVRILDNFTELTAELTAELAARKQQYQYYLNCFFETQTDNLVPLESIGTLTRGKRFVHADATDTGVPCIHYGELYTYYGVHASAVKSHIREDLRLKMRYAHKGDVIIVGAGENNIDIGVGVAWEGNEDVAVHDACYTLKHSQNSKYISYYLRSDMYHSQIKKYVSEGKICSISAAGLGKAMIPIPSLSEQQRIVSILERFDVLCNDITTGLPAEIEARQKQYEYYRDKLLTFKEAV